MPEHICILGVFLYVCSKCRVNAFVSLGKSCISSPRPDILHPSATADRFRRILRLPQTFYGQYTVNVLETPSKLSLSKTINL